MAAPQDSPKRRKIKARRTKQLAEWRARRAKKPAAKSAEKKAAKAPAKK